MFKLVKGLFFTIIWYGSIFCGFYTMMCPSLLLLFIDRKKYRMCTDFVFSAWETLSVVSVNDRRSRNILLYGILKKIVLIRYHLMTRFRESLKYCMELNFMYREI